MSDIIPITPLPNAAATAADGLGCHAGKDQLLDAAAKAGKSDVLAQYAADYPKGPHDQPQSMCPAFGSLRVGLRMRRTATILSGSACCVYGLTFTSHFYGARRTVGYVPFNSETLVTGKLFEAIREPFVFGYRRRDAEASPPLLPAAIPSALPSSASPTPPAERERSRAASQARQSRPRRSPAPRLPQPSPSGAARRSWVAPAERERLAASRTPAAASEITSDESDDAALDSNGMAVVGQVPLAPSGLGCAARRGRPRCREGAGHDVEMHVNKVQLRAAAAA